MTNEHDPFAGWDDNREVHQRINQVQSEAGNPAVVDFSEVDAIAEGMDTVAFGELSPLDGDKDAHDMALDVIDHYRFFVHHHNGTIYADHLGVGTAPSSVDSRGVNIRPRLRRVCGAVRTLSG